MVGRERDSEIIMYLPITNVPGSIGSKAKTLRVKHLLFPGMGVRGGPSDRAHIVHHWTHELLVQQNSIPDEESTSPI